MKKIVLLFWFSSFISCQNQDVFKTVSIKNQYSLDVPDNLTQVNTLNEDASLQFQNLFSEFYIIIIDEPKSGINDYLKSISGFGPNILGYSELITSNLEKAVANSQFSPKINKQINGLKAQTTSLSGRIDNFDVFYKLAFVEGKNHYYQIFTWTTLDKKKEYSAKMDKIIASFKESKGRGK